MADPNPPALRVVEEIEKERAYLDKTEMHDNYTDRARCRDRLAKLERQLLDVHWPALKAALSQPQPQPGAAETLMAATRTLVHVLTLSNENLDAMYGRTITASDAVTEAKAALSAYLKATGRPE